ncbi:uncharacterized protein TOT_040000780 [Theileria orientalis strain Shintoku]|uniref:Uncharacterized protein n=1 Tax=Theileria orientalis strain Shintoku TaxID=869250 RepID=J7M8L9_THEOR|nr:uncharacterized protein TOT_040000780 [Theileria orientalis strain Shintoku]BAM42413.1 uncharacterized protein TOT_040000780 [Theileria orientalis strain Shintoku]|eukprot:XP_009692714.1 uncharacterized protein TOT_040000780 [Theileria orientalis strain Shintoku]
MDDKLDNCITNKCHNNCITSVSLFEDRIVSGGKDSTILIHQKAESELKCLARYNLTNLNGLKCNVTTVDYKDDLILASTSLGVVDLIETPSSMSIKFNAHRNLVSCVKFYSENSIITSGFDNKVRLWDLRNLKFPLYDLMGHTASVNNIDSLPSDRKDDYLVTFGEGYEKILSTGSDRTVNAGTHTVFKIPNEMSQNVESCCLITKVPTHVFAVGLDSNYLLIYSSMSKNHIFKHSFGRNVSVNCIKHHEGLLLVGTNAGELCVFKLQDGFTMNDIVVKKSVPGEFFEGSLPEDAINLTLILALGTEVRLGRWSTVKSKEAKNYLVIKQLSIRK